MSAVVPKQKPGQSEQVVCTPDDFLVALQKIYGEIQFDLAADQHNAIVPAFYGPGSTIATDALSVTWPKESLCFCNPPFGMLKGPNGFAAKAAAEMMKGTRTLLLAPASVGSNWFQRYVWKQASVYFLNPRLTFKAHTQVYPKDLMLCYYDNLTLPTSDVWRWK